MKIQLRAVVPERKVVPERRATRLNPENPREDWSKIGTLGRAVRAAEIFVLEPGKAATEAFGKSLGDDSKGPFLHGLTIATEAMGATGKELCRDIGDTLQP